MTARPGVDSPDVIAATRALDRWRRALPEHQDDAARDAAEMIERLAAGNLASRRGGIRAKRPDVRTRTLSGRPSVQLTGSPTVVAAEHGTKVSRVFGRPMRLPPSRSHFGEYLGRDSFAKSSTEGYIVGAALSDAEQRLNEGMADAILRSLDRTFDRMGLRH